MFNPRSIAFYGASNNFFKMGTGQLSILLSGGYKGKIYPVHPREKTVLELPAYPSIVDVPETPDLAFLVLPTDVVVPVLDECGRAGVPAAIVVSGGFREVGGEGVERERELVEVATRHGITVIGPNCIGVSNSHIGLNTTWFPYVQEPGGISMVSQSGTYSCHIFGHTEQLGIKLSHTISVGNSAMVDVTDCLEYLADEPSTRVIMLYLEGISDGERFARVAGEVTKKKPVVALYVGGTGAGARAGMSHTGALAGEDAIYDGVFRQCGILRAYTIESLLDWAWALATQPRLNGRKICVLTNAGGPGASMADAVARNGLELPVLSPGTQEALREHLPHTAASLNPVDLTFTMDLEAHYNHIPRILFEDENIDGIVMYGVYGSLVFDLIMKMSDGRVSFPVEEMGPVMEVYLSRFADLPHEYGKPLLISSFYGRRDNAIDYLVERYIPVYPSPERAVAAMAALDITQGR